MKIIIIGAGLSGLSTYLALKEYLPNPSAPATPHEIIIYEAQDQSNLLRYVDGQRDSENPPSPTPDSISNDGGIIIGPNGLKVLRHLDQDLFAGVLRTGHCIRSWKISSARGFELGSTSTQSEDKPPMPSFLIGYLALCRILRAHIPEGVISHKEISQVVYAEENGRPRIVPADDSGGLDCDLVLACDGEESVVRGSISGEEPRHQPQGRHLISIGGFIPAHYLSDCGVRVGELHTVFGATGAFSFGYNTPSCNSDTPDSTIPSEAAWWTRFTYHASPSLSETWSREDAISHLRAQYLTPGSSTSPIIPLLISRSSPAPSFFSLSPCPSSVPTTTTTTTPHIPPPAFPWASSILPIGTSLKPVYPLSPLSAPLHAPSLVLEDAETLARLIGRLLQQGYREPGEGREEVERQALKIASARYMEMRGKRREVVGRGVGWMGEGAGVGLGKGRRGGIGMGWLNEALVCAVVWGMNYFGIEAYTREIYNYSVPDEVERVLAKKVD